MRAIADGSSFSEFKTNVSNISDIGYLLYLHVVNSKWVYWVEGRGLSSWCNTRLLLSEQI